MTTVEKLSTIVRIVRKFNNLTQTQIVELTGYDRVDVCRYCQAACQAGFLKKTEGRKYILGELCTPN
jgi:hypothetical protein